MKFHLRAVTAVAVLPLVLGIAACGGEQLTNSAGDSRPMPTPASAPASSPAPPKAAQPVVHLNRASFLPAINSGLAGQKTWRTTARMTAGGKTVMTITGLQQAKPLAVSMVMSGEAFRGGQARILLVNGFAYVSMPGLAPTGKYLKIDAKSSDPAVASFGSMLDSADPTKTFKAFDLGLRNVRFVRSETIDGRKLDRYTVTVDTATALRAQGKTLPAGAPKTLDYTLWMGTDHLVHRMSFDMAGVSMLMTMTEFNKPVSIKAPPARSIVTR
jgi:hypothetical protein